MYQNKLIRKIWWLSESCIFGQYRSYVK